MILFASVFWAFAKCSASSKSMPCSFFSVDAFTMSSGSRVFMVRPIRDVIGSVMPDILAGLSGFCLTWMSWLRCSLILSELIEGGMGGGILFHVQCAACQIVYCFEFSLCENVVCSYGSI